jgi:hypothetical protein
VEDSSHMSTKIKQFPVKFLRKSFETASRFSSNLQSTLSR